LILKIIRVIKIINHNIERCNPEHIINRTERLQLIMKNISNEEITKIGGRKL